MPNAADKPRFGEFSKLYPLASVAAIVITLYVLYTVVHGLRLLQLDLPAHARDMQEVQRALRELILFHVFTALLLYCWVKCVLTHPGTVPDGSGWELAPDSNGSNQGSILKETKDSGERRHCKWCLKYKPDRCHHCRVCNMCVLRMDHHCPWVYNCIGFNNYKYFFLLILYTAVDLLIITTTMFDSVWWSTRSDTPLPLMLVMLSGEAGACFLLVVVSTFVSFHVWLMLRAMTTIEFCEKSKKHTYDSSLYSRGVYRNICSMLGPRPLLWLLPVSFPEGDGMDWQGAAAGRSSSDPAQASQASLACRGSGLSAVPAREVAAATATVQ